MLGPRPDFSAPDQTKLQSPFEIGLIRSRICEGDLYSSHCFRRGATQEIEIAGGPTDQIKGAGCWMGMGFRPYVDTQLTDALKVSRLIARPSKSDSEEGDESPALFAQEDSLREKLRPFPGRTL